MTTTLFLDRALCYLLRLILTIIDSLRWWVVLSATVIIIRVICKNILLIPHGSLNHSMLYLSTCHPLIDKSLNCGAN